MNLSIFRTSLAAATLALAIAAPQAEASLFNFSYIYSGGIIAGTLDGILQGDNNTVIVSTIQDYMTYNGTPLSSMGSVHSWDFSANVTGLDVPAVTLNGSFMDLIACPGVCSGIQSFGWAVNNALAGLMGGPTFSATSDLGSGGPESFNAANWSLTSVGSVPEPATLALLAAGAVGLARRRRAVPAAV